MPCEIKCQHSKREDKKRKNKTYHSERSSGNDVVKIRDGKGNKYHQKSEVEEEEGVERDCEHKNFEI